jgi:hypothetical protein
VGGRPPSGQVAAGQEGGQSDRGQSRAEGQQRPAGTGGICPSGHSCTRHPIAAQFVAGSWEPGRKFTIELLILASTTAGPRAQSTVARAAGGVMSVPARPLAPSGESVSPRPPPGRGLRQGIPAGPASLDAPGIPRHASRRLCPARRAG